MSVVAAIAAQPRPLTRLEALTEAVLERLAAQLPRSVTVERFPARGDDYDMQGRAAAALVICTGGTFARASTPATAALSETVSIVVVLLVRALSGDAGAPSLIEDIRLALQGASLAGARALQPIGWSLVERDEELLRFDFEFETSLPAVAGSIHTLRGAP